MSGLSVHFMIIVVLMVCAFGVATTEFVLVGVLGQVADALGVSVAQAGLLVTAYMLVVSIGGPAATVLTRRVPRRPLLVATMAIALLAATGSAMAPGYGWLMVARMASALAQALFMAVASQVAMAAVAPERRTAAVASVFNGFAVATVAGLPLGTLIGEAFGWRATFVAVAVLLAVGLAGVVIFAPAIDNPAPGRLADSVTPLLTRRVGALLLVTLLSLTGFVAAFTYVEPTLREVTGLSPTWVTVALVVYGAGTIAGTAFAGRIPPIRIAVVLPGAVGALAVALTLQTFSVRSPVAAVAGLLVLGATAFVVVPLGQTWLMGEVGEAAAGVAASVNISAAGLAGAAGAALGAVVIGGPGLVWIGPIAAVPVAVGVVAAWSLRGRAVVGQIGRSVASRP